MAQEQTRKQKNQFTFPANSKAKELAERVEELLAEGVTMRSYSPAGGERQELLESVDIDFSQRYFDTYKDAIEVEVDIDDYSGAGSWMMNREFHRHLLIPTDYDLDIYEFFLKGDIA